MKNYQKNRINLGNISVNSKQVVKFQKINKDLEIVTITASCGCSRPTYDSVNDAIIISFTPEPIPAHLIKVGEYETTKYITVYYKEGSEIPRENLYFTAKIING